MDSDAPVREPLEFGAGLADRSPGIFDRARDGPVILGAILGAALGDAVGLQTEGRDAESARERYPSGLGYPYSEGLKGFPPNAWSDVTEQTIIVLQTLTAYFAAETEDPARHLAASLAAWHRTGVSALDSGRAPDGAERHRPREPLRPPQHTHEGPRPPRRIPADTTTRAVALADFLADPSEAARTITGPKADNGAVYRTLACAFTTAPADWALTLAEVTHADERCSASAVMVSCLVHEIARASARPEGLPAGLADMARGPVVEGRKAIEGEPRRQEYMKRLTESSSLRQLGLGLRDDQTYTLKAAACAMWAFRQLVRTPPARRDSELFRAAISELAMQGGSSCANCAVAGGVLGAALGVGGLPEDWLRALPLKDALAEAVERFMSAAEGAQAWLVEERIAPLSG